MGDGSRERERIGGQRESSFGRLGDAPDALETSLRLGPPAMLLILILKVWTAQVEGIDWLIWMS